MPQTLLALLALVLASFLTFNQQQLTIRSQGNMVTDELELAAAGVASEALALIDGRSFDEATTPSAIAAKAGVLPASPLQFSSHAAFGAVDRGPAPCDFFNPWKTPECDDVDDLDGTGWLPVTISLADELITDPDTGLPYPDSVRARTLDFEVRTEVFYVDSVQSMAPSATQTRHKRVLMDIRTRHVSGEPEGLMRVTRVISYDPVKAEMDYENSPFYVSGEDPS